MTENLKCYLLKMPSVKSFKGRPTFIFFRDGKRIVAVSDNLQSCRVFISDKPIPDEYLVEFTATPEQVESLKLTPTAFSNNRR